MKKLLILSIFFGFSAYAQTPPPPTGGPDDSFSGLPGGLPMDGYVIALLIIASLVGAYFLNRSRQTLVK